MLMVQNNTQLTMKTTKVKGPPPVPPRPNQSVVAEALAKTRKAVAESKANLIKSPSNSKDKQKYVAKSKTLEKSSSLDRPSVAPKQNGLARVKSFIRDVISDRSSSSDERRSSGQNSRRSSSDSSAIPTPASVKKSNESLNSKSVKSYKQILVRSLSASNKLDQENKFSVTKSSSFADKTVPIRRAPPPPLSPKPKLKTLKLLPSRRSTLEKSRAPSQPSPKSSPELSPYSSPIDAKPPRSPSIDAPYATVAEIQDFDDRLRNSPSRQEISSSESTTEDVINSNSVTNGHTDTNSLERKTSRVTEMLISEILASRNNNNNESNSVIDKGKEFKNITNNNESADSDGLPKDMNNHEMLIYELQSMRSQSNVPEMLDNRESVEKSDGDKCESDSEPNYAMSSESGGITDDGSDQAYAYILDDGLKSRLRKQFRAISTMSLQGLPPLPKSLSGFAEDVENEPSLENSPETPEKPPTDLEGQLTYLKKEMASLRQLDLSLLSELWTLSEAMASWRRQLERGTRLRPAPPPPPPPHYLRT